MFPVQFLLNYCDLWIDPQKKYLATYSPRSEQEEEENFASLF